MTTLSKFEKATKFFPSRYGVGNNTIITAFINAFCEEDEDIVLQVRQTKDQLFVSFADGNYLDRLGSSYGVYKPTDPITGRQLVPTSDDMFREYIKLASFKAKTIRPLIYDIFDVYWGPIYSRSYVTNTIAEPYNFGAVPLKLDIQIDNNVVQTIEFDDDDFVSNGAATAAEMCTKINTIYGDKLTAQTFLDSLTGNTYVQILTNTPGGAGSVQIFDQPSPLPPPGCGDANTILQFGSGKSQSTEIAIYELYPKHIILKVPSYVPFDSSILQSHYFHPDQTIYDDRPVVDTAHPFWPGKMLFDGPDSSTQWVPTSTNCLVKETITAGASIAHLTVDDCSSFPNATGKIAFGFGTEDMELITYNGRASNTLLALDPTETFINTWPIDTVLKLMATNDDATANPLIADRSKWGIYLIDTEVGQILARHLIDLIKAAGVIIEFDITETPYLYGDYFWHDITPITGGVNQWIQPPKMTSGQEAVMIAAWGIADIGKIWYNTDEHDLRMWDGTITVIVG